VLTVANFNVHAGVDGWGRPYDLMAACRAIATDVLVLEECWTAEDAPAGGGQAEVIARELGYVAETCALAEGYRALPHPAATAHWMPRGRYGSGQGALFFDSNRALSRATTSHRRFKEARPGSWGIAVLVRPHLSIDGVHTLHLPTLAKDRVRRAAIVVDLTIDGAPVSVVGTHMSHILYGSHHHYWALRALLRTEARPDAVLLGDMNLWGPPVRAYMSGWHRAVRGRTWPAWSPHSQIDHILIRGGITTVAAEVLPAAGSDHRPVRATLQLPS